MTEAATVVGCGADWGDPLKEFCIKLPAGYKAADPSPKGALYSQVQHFPGPAGADGNIPGFDVSVGFSSNPHKTFEEEVAAQITCQMNGSVRPQEAMDACKSVRAYPMPAK